MMKYKVGDKIKIVRTTDGCRGAEGKIGIITNEPSTNGLYDHKEGFNVNCSGYVWRIGFESECELLDELTAEEAIKIQAEMCNSIPCGECEIGKLRSKSNKGCCYYRSKNPDKVVEVLKQYKKNHEEKEIETEIVDFIKVMKEVFDDEKCIYAYEIDMNEEDVEEKMNELVKQYYEENGDKIYAKFERLCRVKNK